MNTQKGIAKFKIFCIPLDSGCSSTILMGIIIIKFTPKYYSVMQGHMQTGSITNNLKDQIYFTLPELSATKIVMWNYHVDDSAK